MTVQVAKGQCFPVHVIQSKPAAVPELPPAAGCQTISSCQWLSQLALQTGQALLYVEPISATIHAASFRLSHPRGGETF